MKIQTRILLEIVIISLLIIGFDLLINNYLFFHVIVELFSIVILFVLFAITWNARRILDNRYLLFVGMAAFFIGILDLLHTLTYKGMNIIPSPIFYANQFWIATRFFESLVLLTGFIFVKNKIKIKVNYLLVLYLIITIAIILSILYFKNFPTCFIENVGQTPFKIYSEYVIISLLVISFLFLRRNKKHFEKDTFLLISTSILLTIASEISFTIYTTNYDYINKVGHIFKVLSFFMIYKANIQNGFTKPLETFFKDIKLSEEKIKETNIELEKQIATRNKFFSIISHDLKNPFTVLVGFSELLMNNYDEYKDVERKKMIKTVHQTSEKTYRLLDNLLAWSRSQINALPFNPVQFDIKNVIDECTNLSSFNGQIKEIKIIKEYHSAIVEADVDMIKSVIRNLLTNAVKFTPRLGKITIRMEENTGYVTVSVIDTGVGISQNKVSSLFQIDNTFTTKGTEGESGSGLGLVLCAEFVNKNNGRIWVESKENEGSTFSFTIPKGE